MDRLTEKDDWEGYWDRIKLPVEAAKSKRNAYINEILNVFDKYLQPNPEISIMEIGGAPGGYLAYIYRKFGYKITGMDYSETGCVKMRENFRLLGIEGEVIQRDLFDNYPRDKFQFDVVYSLGFVEHFSNTVEVIMRHLEYLIPGGILIVGFPNFTGINRWILNHFDPDLLSKHNLEIMNLKHWNIIESTLNLKPVYKNYVGGFEPGMFRTNSKNPTATIIRRLLKFIKNITDRATFLHTINNRLWSGYVMLVYRKTA